MKRCRPVGDDLAAKPELCLRQTAVTHIGLEEIRFRGVGHDGKICFCIRTPRAVIKIIDKHITDILTHQPDADTMKIGRGVTERGANGRCVRLIHGGIIIDVFKPVAGGEIELAARDSLPQGFLGKTRGGDTGTDKDREYTETGNRAPARPDEMIGYEHQTSPWNCLRF